MHTLLTLLLMADVLSAAMTLDCAPCTGVPCIPPSPGCEMGRRPCSCCHECRVPEGGSCGPFTPECESHLVCYTDDRTMYVGRPPVDSTHSGRCLEYTSISRLTNSGHRAGDAAIGKK